MLANPGVRVNTRTGAQRNYIHHMMSNMTNNYERRRKQEANLDATDGKSKFINLIKKQCELISLPQVLFVLFRIPCHKMIRTFNNSLIKKILL